MDYSYICKNFYRMAWKLKYRCRRCGYEAEVYEGHEEMKIPAK